MTWTAKIMPDDALDPSSLVGVMLQGTTEECLAVELSGNPGGLPLWEAMQIAYCADQSRAEAYAAEIEAVRDWLLPNASSWYPYRDLHARMTEQANIARNS